MKNTDGSQGINPKKKESLRQKWYNQRNRIEFQERDGTLLIFSKSTKFEDQLLYLVTRVVSDFGYRLVVGMLF